LLKKSIENAPEGFTDPYHDLAVVYYDTREYDGALKVLEQGRKRSSAFLDQSREFYQLVKEKQGE
jgi:hypothetical protein